MAKWVLLGSFIVALILSYLLVINAISSARIDSWLNRAKDAGNPAQVSEFLQNYKNSLYNADRVEGKYSSIFRYPGSYMPVYIRAIDGLISRAEALSQQSPTEESYQMGLINLEKDLGDIETAAFGVWLADGGWIIIPLLVVAWILVIVFGLWCMMP